MTAIPTILVVGARDVTFQLSGSFPPPHCRVLFAASAAEALNYAANASVMVVDTGSRGEEAVELCRRLRADAVTAAVPLVLRFQPQQSIVQALTDAAVPSNDYDGLVRAIQQLAPDITDGSAPQPDVFDSSGDYDDPDGGDGEGLFNDGQMTVVWRRPEADPDAAAEWPPPAPEHQEGQAYVEYALTFAGYMNSLIEALEDPSKLAEAEYQRLCHVAHRTPGPAEKCLGLVQTAINTSLAKMDLDGMRVLSSAKNSLYEKLQRLRTLLQAVPDVVDPTAPAPRATPRATPAGGPGAAAAAEADDVDGGWTESDTMDEVIQAAMQEVEGQAGPGLVREGPVPRAAKPSKGKAAEGKKSALTLAAEAKQRAKRAEEASRAKAASKQAKDTRLKEQYAIGGSARKGRGLGPLWLWIVLAIVVVLGSGAWITLSLITNDQGKPKIGTQNAPPRLQKVDLEQTISGIVVRPVAKDDEGDRVSFTIRWFVNRAPIPGRGMARLEASKYKVGDDIIAEVRPQDQFNLGAPMSSQPLRVRDLNASAPPVRKP